MNFSFAGLEWLRPEAAWALPLALLLLGVGRWSLARRRSALEAMVHERQLSRFVPGFSPARAALRVTLAGLATLLLGVSLVGPVRGHSLREVVSTGVDLVVCVDTSRSMLARDVRPDRLTRARREVAGLLDVLGSDRVALLAFSGDAREIAPLTHDRAALGQLLEGVSVVDNRLGGTSLAAALRRALDLFDGRSGSSEAIVLITDGEDLAGEGAAVAADARARGIRVFVVGVGTTDGGKIPVVGDDGVEGFLVDADGREVVTRLDRDSLSRLAEATEGEFLSVDEHPTPLEALYEKRIARYKGREFVGGKERIPHDRYQWPLLLALACMLGEAGLRERRGTAGGRR